MDHPDEVKLEPDLALRILRLLDGLSKSKLLGYGTKRGPFEYHGPAIPEAGDLGRRLAEALRPPFGVNDRVVWRSSPSSDVGTVIAMGLWDYGWEIAVAFENEGLQHPDASELMKADV